MRCRGLRSTPLRASSLALVVLGAAVALAVAPLAPRAAPIARLHLVPQAIVTNLGGAVRPRTSTPCTSPSGAKQACYDAAQLQAAYDLQPLYNAGVEGQHQTIVIVDCYGSPTIAADLSHFDATFHLPAPPSFKIDHPVGPIPAYSPSGRDRFGWAAETTLDVEWAHALAPKASIVLVETPTDEVEGTSGFPDIVAAEKWVLAHKLGRVISQSFTATEQTFPSFASLSPLRAAYKLAATDDVTVLAGSGDLGATDYESNASSLYPYRVTSWPASDPLITAVGGTRLDLSTTGTQLAAATAWNDTYLHATPSPAATGGGRSIFFARPAYQHAVAATTGSRRGVPDISMSAACSASVDVYLSARGPSGPPGWTTICGTSEATPLFAAIVALCDQEAGRGLGQLNPTLYAMLAAKAKGIVAVTSGNNTVSFGSTTVTGFQAGPGYSLVTGVGTVDAASFVPELVAEWTALHH